MQNLTETDSVRICRLSICNVDYRSVSTNLTHINGKSDVIWRNDVAGIGNADYAREKRELSELLF